MIDPSDLLALVDASPRLVASHDREGWLALFAASATIADPVGSPPARREAGQVDGLGVFYDNFIARTDIRFEVLRDHVAPMAILRDAVIHNTLPGGARVSVPTLILYEAEREGGGLRLSGLRSWWDLREPPRALRAQGWRGLRALLGQSWTMTRRLGPVGLWRYFRSPSRGMGDARAERVVVALARAMSGADPLALMALGGAVAPLIESPCGVSADPGAILGRASEPAGHFWGGWSLACRLVIAGEPSAAVVDLAPGTDHVRRVRLFGPAREPRS